MRCTNCEDVDSEAAAADWDTKDDEDAAAATAVEDAAAAVPDAPLMLLDLCLHRWRLKQRVSETSVLQKRSVKTPYYTNELYRATSRLGGWVDFEFYVPLILTGRYDGSVGSPSAVLFQPKLSLQVCKKGPILSLRW